MSTITAPWPTRQADGRQLHVLTTGGAAAKPGLQLGGTVQAGGDADEDERKIGGAEGFVRRRRLIPSPVNHDSRGGFPDAAMI
jgi:hypothetical protein